MSLKIGSNDVIDIKKGSAQILAVAVGSEIIWASQHEATASGAVVVINDALNKPVIDLTVGIEPKQAGSGTPSPSNIRPISGWDNVNLVKYGKNIFNKNANGRASNASCTPIDTGVRATVTAAGIDRFYAIPIGKSELLNKTVKLSTSVLISASNTAQAYLFFGNATSSAKQFIGGISNTTSGRKTSTIIVPNQFPTDCDRIWILLYANARGTGNVGDYVDYTDLQIEIGSTFTAYEPYNPQSQEITIPLGRTVYGGSLDVTTGVLTVNYALQTFTGAADEAWIDNTSEGTRFNLESYSNTKPMYSDKLEWVDVSIPLSNMPKLSFKHLITQGYIAVKYPDGVSSANDWKTWLASNNVTIAYEIEPQTYQLTPIQISTLLGNNTIFADSGDITVRYWAKGYIN